MAARYAVGHSLSLSVGIQPPPDADGIWASRVRSYLWHQQPLLLVQSCAVPHPPPHPSLFTTSKQTLSHLSVLTSAVCPVLPASLWCHLKTLFSAKTHYCTVNTHSHADTATHRHINTNIQRHKNTWTHRQTSMHICNAVIYKWDKMNLESNIKVFIYLK